MWDIIDQQRLVMTIMTQMKLQQDCVITLSATAAITSTQWQVIFIYIYTLTCLRQTTTKVTVFY